MRSNVVLFLCTIICILSPTVEASEPYDTTAFERELFKDPLFTYQSLLQHSIKLPTASTPLTTEEQNAYLWWLLRKAQAEQLLYLYEKFEATINQALQHITPDSPLLIQSQFNLFQGILYRNKGEYKTSSEHLKQALEQSKRGGHESIYIQARQENAYTQSLAELFEISLTGIQEAYVKAYGMNDKYLIASINETYGAIYGYMHDYKKSVEYYTKALETYETLGYKAHIAEAIYGLASTYRYWKKFDLAIKYFKRYRLVTNYTPNDDISFYAAYGLGMTLAEQGKCAEGLVIINQALAKQGVQDYKSELFKNKAMCLAALGKTAEATNALNNAKTIFNELPDLQGTSWQLETLQIESQIAFANNEYKRSYQLLESYYQQYVEVLIKNSSDRLLNVRANMELERQDVERALALQRYKVATLKEKALQQQNIQQQYFVIFLLVIIAIVVAIIIFQRKSHNKMRQLSITDPLSGAYNRRYIFTFLENLLANMTPNKGSLALLLLDIDDFKQINDQYGHPAGDFIIKHIAKIGQDVLRTGDVIARVGGEEFLCVLPRTSEIQAEEIAERMLAAIASYSFCHDGKNTINATVSIGIANYSEQHCRYDSLYSQADKALYQAKARGKNCIVIT